MNRLAERVVAVMNDDEVRALIIDHYRGESQTLTTGAEANFLKFKELIGAQTAGETARWHEIRQTFRRNQITRGAGDGQNDPVARVVGQLSAFHAGLQSIQETLEKHLSKPPATDLAPLHIGMEALRAAVEAQRKTPAPEPVREAPMIAAQLSEGLKSLGDELSRAISSVHTGTMAQKVDSLSHELEMIHSTLASLKHLAAQRLDHLTAAQQKLAVKVKEGSAAAELTQEMIVNERTFLEKLSGSFDYTRKWPTRPADE